MDKKGGRVGVKDGESHLEYRKRVMDTVSPTFCAAKWVNATIWLNSGLTTSCHHPPSHPIALEEIKKNPSAIHNSQHKKKMRELMLKGERPPECEYCWKIEDLGKDHISDRVFKTFIYKESEILDLKSGDPFANWNLKTLEIAFDRTCQLACMYCNPSYSSTWVRDIAENGPYKNLNSDRRKHFVDTHPMAEPFKIDDNPYIQAFWRWWPELSQSLDELRITGGEPLLSPHFWRVLENVATSSRPEMRIAVNSNLSARDEYIDRLISVGRGLPHLEVYSSGEAYGSIGEYIRDGLNWQRWTSNMEKLMSSGAIHRVHVMMTINSLSLFGMRDFLQVMYDWKLKFGRENPTFSINILRHPTFQSALALPDHLIEKARLELSEWYLKVKDDHQVLDFEKDSLRRFLSYLEAKPEITEGSAGRPELQKDLKRYLKQFDMRRKKNFKECMPAHFVEWLDQVKA